MSAVLPFEVATGEALRLVVDLVRIPALSSGEQAAADFTQVQMERLGFEGVHRDICGNVIGYWQGARPGPTLLLEAHLDVVPPGDESAWHYPPYGGVVSAGRVWGRGAADTHASLAAMLAAVASLPRSDLCGRVVVAATVMEESLTAGAVEGLLAVERPDVFVTGEPTALRLGVAQKGRATLEIRTVGRAAHTSHPEQGINAIRRMMHTLTRIENLPRRWDEVLGGEVFEVTEIVSQPYPNINVVPPGCQARLVARLLPDETPQSLQVRLTQAMAGLDGVEITLARLCQTCYTGHVLEREDFLVGWRMPAEHIWRVRILDALRSRGLPAETLAAGFGTNASAAAAIGIPCFIYGPGDLAQAHTVDEWVAIEQVEQAVAGYRALVQACLGSPCGF